MRCEPRQPAPQGRQKVARGETRSGAECGTPGSSHQNSLAPQGRQNVATVKHEAQRNAEPSPIKTHEPRGDRRLRGADQGAQRRTDLLSLLLNLILSRLRRSGLYCDRSRGSAFCGALHRWLPFIAPAGLQSKKLLLICLFSDLP
jgi:hypothetical protein